MVTWVCSLRVALTPGSEEFGSYGVVKRLTFLADGKPIWTTKLGGEITVTPWLVPHRDEYTETVGFLISTKRSKALFLPDIDKWERWERSLPDILDDVDYAFLDATFFSEEELPGRSLEEIPHPTITETMSLLESLPDRQRRKVHRRTLATRPWPTT